MMLTYCILLIFKCSLYNRFSYFQTQIIETTNWDLEERACRNSGGLTFARGPDTHALIPLLQQDRGRKYYEKACIKYIRVNITDKTGSALGRLT